MGRLGGAGGDFSWEEWLACRRKAAAALSPPAAGCGRWHRWRCQGTYGRDPGGQAVGHSLSVDIVIQIAQRYHGELIIAQMGDIALELIGIGVDPGVVEIGDAVEGEYRDAPVAGLV